jgi:hypothetical protein
MSALFQWEQRGHIRSMNPEGNQPAGDCIEPPEPQIILMGSGITDAAGEWSLDVRPAVCVGLYIIDWVAMVATPSQRMEGEGIPPVGPPPIITTEWQAFGGYLTLRARTRDGNGNPLPNVPFSWHAAVLHHLE